MPIPSPSLRTFHLLSALAWSAEMYWQEGAPDLLLPGGKLMAAQEQVRTLEALLTLSALLRMHSTLTRTHTPSPIRPHTGRRLS